MNLSKLTYFTNVMTYFAGLEELKTSVKLKPEPSSQISGGPSSSQVATPSSSQVTAPPKLKKSCQWSLRESLKREYVADPTSLAAALARVKPER